MSYSLKPLIGKFADKTKLLQLRKFSGSPDKSFVITELQIARSV